MIYQPSVEQDSRLLMLDLLSKAAETIPLVNKGDEAAFPRRILPSLTQ